MISNGDLNGHKTLNKGVVYAGATGLLPPLACYLELANPMYMISGTAVNLLL